MMKQIFVILISFLLTGCPARNNETSPSGGQNPQADTPPSPSMPINHNPVASHLTVILNEDTPISITLPAADEDADALTFTVITLPLHGTMTGTIPDITYTPAANFAGNDSLVFKVSDGKAESSESTVTFQILPINDAPVANDSTFAIRHRDSMTEPLPVNDEDSATLNAAVVQAPTQGNLYFPPNSKTFNYIPNFFASGTDTFTYRVTDGLLESDVKTITIQFLPPLNGVWESEEVQMFIVSEGLSALPFECASIELNIAQSDSTVTVPAFQVDCSRNGTTVQVPRPAYTVSKSHEDATYQFYESSEDPNVYGFMGGVGMGVLHISILGLPDDRWISNYFSEQDIIYLTEIFGDYQFMARLRLRPPSP